MVAAENGYVDVIEQLLVVGADINAKDNNGQLLNKYHFFYSYSYALFQIVY